VAPHLFVFAASKAFAAKDIWWKLNFRFFIARVPFARWTTP